MVCNQNVSKDWDNKNIYQHLFALFLNVMETIFLAQKWNTLKVIDKLYNDSNDDINGMLNLFVPCMQMKLL